MRSRADESGTFSISVEIKLSKIPSLDQPIVAPREKTSPFALRLDQSLWGRGTLKNIYQKVLVLSSNKSRCFCFQVFAFKLSDKGAKTQSVHCSIDHGCSLCFSKNSLTYLK